MSTPTVTAGMPPPPAPPAFDAGKQAGELIAQNTHQDCTASLPAIGGIDCHPDTDGHAVGSQIGGVATSDPAKARAVFDKVMEKTPDAHERREVARGLVQSMTHEQLGQLGSTPEGRAMLERARAEMGLNDGAANKTGMARIESALKATDLKKEAGFQKLDAATQKNLLDEIGRQQEQPAAVDNLVALAKSPGFQAASPATQAALQSTLLQHARDPVFREGLAKLAGDAAFQKLTPAQQADALGAFDKFAKGEVYHGKEGSWFFGVGGKQVGDADKRAMLDNARQVVTSAGFHDVGAGASRQAMMNALGRHPTDAGFTARLVKLANDPGFRALNDATKETRLLERYGADNSFAQGVDTLLRNPKTTWLSGADKAKVLGDVVKLSETRSYRDANATDRQALVEIVGDISAYSAGHPSNTTLRNTVDKVVDGHMKLGLYQRPPIVSGGQTFYNYGKADANGIYLNTDPAVRSKAVTNNQYIDTLAHEVNHKINGTTTPGTADRFLSEYRAAVVGQEAALGRTLTPAEQRASVRNLIDGTNPDYAHIANRYNTDAKFKAGVDAILTRLNGSTDPATGTSTPAATVTPEDARGRLIAAGNSSDYLNKAGNVDNH